MPKLVMLCRSLLGLTKKGHLPIRYETDDSFLLIFINIVGVKSKLLGVTKNHPLPYCRKKNFNTIVIVPASCYI